MPVPQVVGVMSLLAAAGAGQGAVPLLPPRPQHEVGLPPGARRSWKNGGVRRDAERWRSAETLEEWRARLAADDAAEALRRHIEVEIPQRLKALVDVIEKCGKLLDELAAAAELSSDVNIAHQEAAAVIDSARKAPRNELLLDDWSAAVEVLRGALADNKDSPRSKKLQQVDEAWSLVLKLQGDLLYAESTRLSELKQVSQRRRVDAVEAEAEFQARNGGMPPQDHYRSAMPRRK